MKKKKQKRNTKKKCRENFRVICQNYAPLFPIYTLFSLSFVQMLSVLTFHQYMKTHSIEPLMNPNVKIRDMKKKFMCTSCHYHKTNDLYFWSVFISIILIFVFICLCVSFYRFSSILLWSERYTFVHSNRQKKNSK